MVQSKIETFTAMLAEQPENAMIWYGLASEQYKLENWAEAAKSLRQVVSLNPDYTAAYQMAAFLAAFLDYRARIHTRQAHPAAAVQFWDQTRSTPPQNDCEQRYGFAV